MLYESVVSSFYDACLLFKVLFRETAIDMHSLARFILRKRRRRKKADENKNGIAMRRIEELALPYRTNASVAHTISF
jgi:hypothetical protein